MGGAPRCHVATLVSPAAPSDPPLPRPAATASTSAPSHRVKLTVETAAPVTKSTVAVGKPPAFQLLKLRSAVDDNWPTTRMSLSSPLGTNAGTLDCAIADVKAFTSSPPQDAAVLQWEESSESSPEMKRQPARATGACVDGARARGGGRGEGGGVGGGRLAQQGRR